ncbi:MAG: PepSY domain-containing protein [Rhizobiaceae bacterium]|nr:PepSY domain-containing protein [Rhizobiaceae bacterium]
MKRSTSFTASAAAGIIALGLACGIASATESNIVVTAETAAKITEVLKAQGYDVRKIDSEDGRFEAYALKDGKKYEIYLDAAFAIVETKLSD